MREPQLDDAPVAGGLEGLLLGTLRGAAVLLVAPVVIGVLVRLALGPGSPGMAGFVAILTAVALSPGLALSALALTIAGRLGLRTPRLMATVVAAVGTVLLAASIWMMLLSLIGALLAVASVLIAGGVILSMGSRPTRRATLQMMGAIAVAGPFVVGQALVGLSYPVVIVTPEVVGRIEATRSDADDWPAWFAILQDQEIRIEPHDDRVLGPAIEGYLLLFGTQPERWFVGAEPSDDDGCYRVNATKGYDEPDSVLLIYQHWPSIGIRLQKAPEFDAPNRIVHDPDGRPQYDDGFAVTFCVDEHGRLLGLWP